MNYVIQFFGVLLIVLGAVLIIKPKAVFDFARKNFASLGFKISSVVLNLVLGVALIDYADSSKFPIFFVILGLLVILKAIIPILTPRSDYDDLVSWRLDITSPFGHAIGAIEVLFGGFLIYAVV